MSFPAVVTITDLPTGTTLTGAELLEAVQTAGGVGQSIQLSINQIMATALGALPTAGGTGQLLQKASGTNFSAQWANISSMVSVGTGLATSGTVTGLTVSFASTAGLSVLGVNVSGSAFPAAISGVTNQVLVIDPTGATTMFGAVNLAAAAAITGTILTASLPAINVGSTGGGGITGQPFFQPATAPPVAGSSTVGIRVTSASLMGIYIGSGTPTFAAGTGSLYVNNGAATATSRLYINTNGSTSWANFTASL